MVANPDSDRIVVARLLKQLAEDQIDEGAFRDQMSQVAKSSDDPVIELAQDEADEYLRTFEDLTIFGRQRSPDPYQVSSGKESLLIIVRGIEESWPLKRILDALRWV
jgi:hypothetical protein